MDDGLQLTLLGKPEMSRNGALVTGLVYKKSLALLCYLAVTGRPHTRAALAGLLWGEATEANARGGLRKSLADLRRWVAPHLTIARRQVAFDRARPYWVDVEVFERRVSEAMGTIERDGALTDEDATRLAGAVELYQDGFLEGFHVRRAPAFEEWVLLTRERLRLSALRALHALAAHYTARGAYTEGIAYTDRLLALAPEQEEAHRQMMSLLALSGQQGAALRQYQNCCRVLAEELGVEPEEETTALYERIRDGVELDARSLAPRHNMPIPPTPLIGRNVELARVLTHLQDPACRQLTLIGSGGSGKTCLALEAATALLTNDKTTAFTDGGFFVPLAPLRSVEAIVPAVAQSLGFHFYEEHEPCQQLLNYVRKKRLLLVLDSFEHLLDGVDLVRDILETASGVKILVTSRARLNLQGEQLFPVAGLDCSQQTTENLDDFQSFAAVELFLQSVRRIRPDLELTDDDVTDVARICCLVEGLKADMMKPTKLQPGDKVATVSLSWGGPGVFPHRYEVGKRQLQDEFGVTVVEMPHTLSDASWLQRNPRARADDLMQAFADSSIKAIISTIGGDDSIRILPFLDLDVIRSNPKIFMGCSDTTVTHLACLKAGLVSFYGPSIMAGFAENGGMFSYMAASVRKTLFSSAPVGSIAPNTEGWTVEFLDWAEPENQTRKRSLTPSTGWKFLQGRGSHRGHLIGGCFEALDWLRGTDFLSAPEMWQDVILFLETSEEAPPPTVVLRGLRTYAAMGILKELASILFGRPGGQVEPEQFDEYDQVISQVILEEEGLTDLPIITHVDFGHTDPMFVLPYGIQAEINCDTQQFTIIESAVGD